MEDGMSVRQTSSTALTIDSAAERNRYLTSVAQKKRRQPSAYKAEVMAGLSKVDTMQRASRIFGMPEDQITQAIRFYRTLLLKRGVDVVGDALIESKSTQAITAEGNLQAANLGSNGTSSSG
jgi:hypothetical protein